MVRTIKDDWDKSEAEDKSADDEQLLCKQLMEEISTSEDILAGSDRIITDGDTETPPLTDEQKKAATLKQLENTKAILSKKRNRKIFAAAGNFLKIALQSAALIVGIATCNPVAIVGGIFDLCMMASGFYGSRGVSMMDLSNKLKKMDEKLDQMDKQLDQITTMTSKLHMNQKTNTIINQISPAVSNIGTLWYQFIEYKNMIKFTIDGLANENGSDVLVLEKGVQGSLIDRFEPRLKILQKQYFDIDYWNELKSSCDNLN